MKVLALNPGSSSLKYALFRIESGVEELLDRATLTLTPPSPKNGRGGIALTPQPHSPKNRRGRLSGRTSAALDNVNSTTKSNDVIPLPSSLGSGVQIAITSSIVRSGGLPDAVACRVVHGGSKFTDATVVTPNVLEAICDLTDLAPLHNPAAVEAIETARRLLPNVPIVAVFDTAFHRTLPPVASNYALPFELAERLSLRRYGFHGISHQYVSGRLLACIGRPAEGSRLITCHLGNGASVCAIRDGISIDTSMGMTPLEGLMMGTRTGDVDPGVLIHLLRHGVSTDELDDLLNHKSGLLGVSGTSHDTRDLERAAKSGDSRAELALEMFAYRVRKYIGAYFAALGGADAIAFTGGIGEHSAEMRARICRDLERIEIGIDEIANRSAPPGLETNIGGEGRTGVWVIPTDEERQMAREAIWTLSRLLSSA